MWELNIDLSWNYFKILIVFLIFNNISITMYKTITRNMAAIFIFNAIDNWDACHDHSRWVFSTALPYCAKIIKWHDLKLQNVQVFNPFIVFWNVSLYLGLKSQRKISNPSVDQNNHTESFKIITHPIGSLFKKRKIIIWTSRCDRKRDYEVNVTERCCLDGSSCEWQVASIIYNKHCNILQNSHFWFHGDFNTICIKQNY